MVESQVEGNSSSRKDLLWEKGAGKQTQNLAELNYTVTEKEALAVVKALKNYEDILQGAKVTVITDE